MRCDRGRVILVNALNIDQSGLRLFGSSSKQTLLWTGSIASGGVEEIFLHEPLGSNMLLEGTNAVTAEKFSEQSDYVSSVVPYGTYIYLVLPDGIRTTSYGHPEPPGDASTPLMYEFLRVGFQEIFYATRCVDEDFMRRLIW